MRFIDRLCPPALLYLVFVTLSVGLDVSFGLFVTAAVKTILGIATVVVLDTLCSVDLGIVAWALVAAPFVITALGTAIAMGTGFDGAVMEHFSMSPAPVSETSDIPKTIITDDLPVSAVSQ
jgi:hypothetical protein